jgi:hypothetical protein
MNESLMEACYIDAEVRCYTPPTCVLSRAAVAAAATGVQRVGRGATDATVQQFQADACTGTTTTACAAWRLYGTKPAHGGIVINDAIKASVCANDCDRHLYWLLNVPAVTNGGKSSDRRDDCRRAWKRG